MLLELQRSWQTFKRDFRWFRTLWGTVPADCRVTLIMELLFDSAALRRRYEEECKLHHNLKTGWQ